MEPHVVGIREFRERLAEYLLHSDRPVAVTRHGATVGYFIPTRAARADLDRATLQEAALRMDELLQHAGFTQKDMEKTAKEFGSWRKKKRK